MRPGVLSLTLHSLEAMFVPRVWLARHCMPGFVALETLKSGVDMGRRLHGIGSARRRGQFGQPLGQQKQEVEGLRALRQIAGKGQADVASALNIKQPSVSKIEKQSDMYLSTLRSYVEAIGGQLELIVKLPTRPTITVQCLGDVGLENDEQKNGPLTRRRAASR